jgi:hypothetical protein
MGTRLIFGQLASRDSAFSCTNFRKFLIEGTKPNLKKINEYIDRSLMLVTALSPVMREDAVQGHVFLTLVLILGLPFFYETVASSTSPVV